MKKTRSNPPHGSNQYACKCAGTLFVPWTWQILQARFCGDRPCCNASAWRNWQLATPRRYSRRNIFPCTSHCSSLGVTVKKKSCTFYRYVIKRPDGRDCIGFNNSASKSVFVRNWAINRIFRKWTTRNRGQGGIPRGRTVIVDFTKVQINIYIVQ